MTRPTQNLSLVQMLLAVNLGFLGFEFPVTQSAFVHEVHGMRLNCINAFYEFTLFIDAVFRYFP